MAVGDISTTVTYDDFLECVEVFVVSMANRSQLHLAGGTNREENGRSTRVLVKVTDSAGRYGWGEATPTPAWTYETLESMLATLANYVAPAVVGTRIWDLHGLHRRADEATRPGLAIGNPLARSALDVAMHDLLGHAAGIPVCDLLGGSRIPAISLGWIVADPERTVAVDMAQAGLSAGYSGFKVKLGLTGSIRNDLETVAAVREAIGDRYLLVDANQAYTVDEALRVGRGLEELHVDAFEQPVPAIDLPALQHLRSRLDVPIAVDESVRGPRALSTTLQLGCSDLVVAKVQRDGGLFPARRVCEMTLDFGLRLVGSGLTDSDLGFAASVHLFSAFGITTPVDLNGPQFIEPDYATEAIPVQDGLARVPHGPGLGVRVDEDRVRDLDTRYRREHGMPETTAIRVR